MHKIGLDEVEEDGQVLFHIWSSFDLLAFFPFPKLIRKYIYYDDQVPADVKKGTWIIIPKLSGNIYTLMAAGVIYPRTPVILRR